MNDPIATSIDYNSIKLSWSPITSDADTGRDPIIYYKVMFLDYPCYQNDVDSCFM